ncbi:PREDICTED: E3 ubiquitin-protein ligase LRSAM1-like, partial [Acropora digitifera]|uniref:E3 ubiquitin-protein ligase LRSAM1-like n=1 Tax=Acropora digitifera TaxID=70779 RepID=UPI00077A9DD3
SILQAKESPEPAFDLSKCGATEVPKGVYSLCKVLQKEALLMFDNALTNLKGGGSLKDLSALRVLDLHDNFITTLPADIDQLKALQVLVLNHQWTKIADPVGKDSSSSKHCGPTPVDDLIANTLSLHEAEKEKRRQQLLEIERQIHETEQEQQALAVLANKQRIDLVDKIRIAEAEMDDLTMHQQQQQDLERQKLVSAMAADEQLANDTVAMILQVNERAQKTEIILDELEQERMRTDHLVKITQEETERLKKEEVLASMAKLLESQESQGRLIREYERSREKAASQAMNESWEADMRLVGILNEQYDDRDALISEISKEERAQMEAIQALQLQTDAKHCRITNQISMLQEELSKLTLTELDKRDERQDVERVCVAITDVSHPILNNTQRFCDDLPVFVTRVYAHSHKSLVLLHPLYPSQSFLFVSFFSFLQSDVVLLNCGHVCCCFTCSSALTACPMCRKPVVQRVRIFIS